MTSRAQIDDIIERYANTPRRELPQFLRTPKSEHEFALAFALETRKTPGVEPVYDAGDNLTGWRGISLR